jgi:hypothetical protein
MVRVGVRLGPFYVSSSTRRRRLGPTAAQRRAQAAATAQRRARQSAATAAHRAQVAANRAQRRETYGAYKVADVRTWFSWHWLLGIVGLLLALALPGMIGDGPNAQAVWAIAVGAGIVVWVAWVVRLHAEQAPARRQAAAHAASARQQAEAAEAQARHQAQLEAARRAAEYAAYMAPKQVGTVWRHGGCPVNHRTRDVAARCTRG